MLSIIAAMSENRVIGRNGTLPWHLPADLAHFKQLTLGHAMIMGRKTFDSIGKPLPGRTSIVLTRAGSIHVPGVITAGSFDLAIKAAQGDDEIFVIGGSEVFAGALPIADRLYLTIVHTVIADGDVYFPSFDEKAWTLLEERHVPADERNAHAMTFRNYEMQRSLVV